MHTCHMELRIRIYHSFVILSNIFKTAVKKKKKKRRLNAKILEKKGEEKKKKKEKSISTYLRRTICVKNLVVLPV